MSDKNKGILFTIISAVAYGLTPLLCPLAYAVGANPETVVFLRNFFALPILLCIILSKKIDIRLPKGIFWKILVVSVLGMATTNVLLYSGYTYLPVGTVTTLHFMYPVFVALFGIVFFKEKLGKLKGIVLTIATCGIFFFMETGSSVSMQQALVGILVSLASGVTYAFYMVAIERMKLKDLNSYVLTFYITLFTCVSVGIYAICIDKFAVFTMQPIGFIYTFIIAFGAAFIAVYTLQLGIKYLGASTAAIFCTFEPVTAVIGGMIFLHESMSVNKLVGCILILGAVTVLSILDNKKN